MPSPTRPSPHQLGLRVQAEAQLGATTDAAARALMRATEALGALHTLASSPATASAALALLHELQVHQVELSLQAEELADSRHELEAALRRMILLYDTTPMSCCTVDVHFTLHEINQHAATWLDRRRELMVGQSMSSWQTEASRWSLLAAMLRLQAGSNEEHVTLTLKRRAGNPVQAPARMCRDPDVPNHFLMAWMTPAEPRV